MGADRQVKDGLGHRNSLLLQSRPITKTRVSMQAREKERARLAEQQRREREAASAAKELPMPVRAHDIGLQSYPIPQLELDDPETEFNDREAEALDTRREEAAAAKKAKEKGESCNEMQHGRTRKLTKRQLQKAGMPDSRSKNKRRERREKKKESVCSSSCAW